MATKCELPEKVNEQLLRKLQEEIEVINSKEDVVSDEETNESVECACSSQEPKEISLKIVCVGGYTGGVGTKGVFIDDYLHVWPPVMTYRAPLIGVKFYVKVLRWQKSIQHKPLSIKLQIWEIAEQERFSKMVNVYFKDSHGALVFWGARRRTSLDEAQRWREKVMDTCPSIPCVLVTDNIAKEPMQWIGPGKIFESNLALEQFCKNHGFVDHFEIKSRDWETGEKSVFGQAVNCLLDEILKNQPCELAH